MTGGIIQDTKMEMFIGIVYIIHITHFISMEALNKEQLVKKMLFLL